MINNKMKISVSFRIVEDKLDPLEISKLLNLNPDVAHKKGDPNIVITKKGKVLIRSHYNTGMWSLNKIANEEGDLSHEIAKLLQDLYPRRKELLALFNLGYVMDVFCGVFIYDVEQPGFAIEPKVLKMLGELNIKFSLCMYN